MRHVAPSDPQNVSPTKLAPFQSGYVTSENVPVLSDGPDDNTSVHTKVARLSICESKGLPEDVVSNLKELEKMDEESTSTPGSSEGQQGKLNRRSKRRRRSSAVSLPGSGKLKPAIKQGNNLSSSIIPVKKKKKTLKATVKVKLSPPDKAISIRDLRDLTMYVLDGVNNSPKWLTIENRLNIKKVLVFVVPGLQVEDFNLPSGSKFRENAENLQECHLKGLDDKGLITDIQTFPVSAPGSNTSLFSAYNSFINVSLSKKEKKARREELDKKKITINDLLMNLDELIGNDYPIHLETPDLNDELRKMVSKKQETDTVEYINTRRFQHEGSHIFALDCEMCLAEEGLVLTRVSIVDFNLNVVYDKLVKPDTPIIDYLTKYSGITEGKLLNVTTTLQDVQEDILKIVSSEDILIGHSLQSDLNVLRLRHPRIVDTAIIFDHKAGPPFKPALRYLAATYLKHDIQKDDATGHNSIEDSTACMELVKLKIANGMGFGLTINTENMFHKLAKVGVKSLRLSDAGPKLQITRSENSDSAIRCESDLEIMNAITDNIDHYDLFVSRLRGLEFARGYASPSILRSVETSSPEAALHLFATSVQRIYQQAPSGTLILAFSGCGDTRKWSDLMKELNSMNKEERMEERQKRESEIEETVAIARDGVGFVLLKQD